MSFGSEFGVMGDVGKIEDRSEPWPCRGGLRIFASDGDVVSAFTEPDGVGGERAACVGVRFGSEIEGRRGEKLKGAGMGCVALLMLLLLLRGEDCAGEGLTGKLVMEGEGARHVERGLAGRDAGVGVGMGIG